jgi:hypothetical protein
VSWGFLAVQFLYFLARHFLFWRAYSSVIYIFLVQSPFRIFGTVSCIHTFQNFWYSLLHPHLSEFLVQSPSSTPFRIFGTVSFIHAFQNCLHAHTNSCSVGFTVHSSFSRSLRDFVKEFERQCFERSFIYPAVNSWSLTSRRNHLSYKIARYEEVTTKPVGMQLFISSVCYINERQYCILRPYICRVV